MPEIGPTLREARIRRRLEIAAVEEQTKIRTKYLRALENEEWDLLPGSSYVKTFLRGYAEFLGLDAQLLLDEYVARFAAPGEGELFSQYTEPPLRERRLPPRAPGPLSPLAIVAGIAVLLLGFLLVLGLTTGDDAREPTRKALAPPVTAPAATAPTTTTPTATTRAPAPKPERVSTRIAADGPVWVCVVNSRRKKLIDGEVIQAGSVRGPFRDKRLRATFGNGQATLRVNGRTIDVPSVSKPIGYEITPAGVRRLPAGRGPTCA